MVEENTIEYAFPANMNIDEYLPWILLKVRNVATHYACSSVK